MSTGNALKLLLNATQHFKSNKFPSRMSFQSIRKMQTLSQRFVQIETQRMSPLVDRRLLNFGGMPLGIVSKLNHIANAQSPFLPFDVSRRYYDAFSDWKGLVGHEDLVILNAKDIEYFISSNNLVLIMFYAPWCHHCKDSKPEFAKAAKVLSSQLPKAKLGVIDCILNPSVYEKYDLTGYPTFKFYRGGREIMEYNNRRLAKQFVQFMIKNQS